MSKRTRRKALVVKWELPSPPTRDFPAGRYTEILTITGGVPEWISRVSHGSVVRLDARDNPIPWEPKTVSWNLTALKFFIREYVRLGKLVGIGRFRKEFEAFRRLRKRYRPLLNLIERAEGMNPSYDIPGLLNAKTRARKLLLALASALAGYHSKGIGAPKGTRSLTYEEQQLAEKLRRRGKGTEKGSARMIASQIAEQRNYSFRTEGRRGPAMARTLKRHFQRKRI